MWKIRDMRCEGGLSISVIKNMSHKYKPCNLKFSINHILKGKNKMKLILINCIYFNMTEMSFQHVIKIIIIDESFYIIVFLLSQRNLMCILLLSTSQFILVTFQVLKICGSGYHTGHCRLKSQKAYLTC